MTFNSFSFWLIFPIIFLVYWLIPVKWNTWRKVFLVLTSYLLYMNWKPAFAVVLLSVTLTTYGGAYLLNRQNITKRKKNIVWLFTILGILPLLTFKYYNFINNSLTIGLAAIGMKFAMPGLNWAIPVGISFFTFQAVGYMLDVYHKRIKVENNLLDYVLFVSFFPQITSGPISTAENLMLQIKSSHEFDYETGKLGLKQLLWGMFIKLVIADRLGLFVDAVYSNYIYYNGSTCFVASLFYTLQIYCDFAGYSLMAIGIAHILGFNLIDNFRRPYFATSITDFWKRWHISLTQWLTRQVYIPMGGSRCNKSRTYWNIFITFLVSGIWHGANWTFIVWGCIHGGIQIIEKALGWQEYKGKNWVLKVLRIAVTFLLVNFAWVFFRMPDIRSVIAILSQMFTDWEMPALSLFDNSEWMMLVTGVVLLLLKDFKDEFFHGRIRLLNTPVIRWSIYVLIFCIILNLGIHDGGSFIYVSF